MFSSIEALAWFALVIVMVIICLAVEQRRERQHWRTRYGMRVGQLRTPNEIISRVRAAQPGELVMVPKEMTPADIAIARARPSQDLTLVDCTDPDPAKWCLICRHEPQAGFVRVRHLLAMAAMAAVHVLGMGFFHLVPSRWQFSIAWVAGMLAMAVAVTITLVAEALDRKEL